MNSDARIAELKNALAVAIQSINDSTTYYGDDDEVGHRACCDVLSYKPHASGCVIHKLNAILRKS